MGVRALGGKGGIRSEIIYHAKIYRVDREIESVFGRLDMENNARHFACEDEQGWHCSISMYSARKTRAIIYMDPLLSFGSLNHAGRQVK